MIARAAALLLAACLPACAAFAAAEETGGTGRPEWEYREKEDGTLEITGHSGEPEAAEVTVPVMLDGKQVTSIGESAFQRDAKLVRVRLPDGLKSIGYGAFMYCENLTDVVLPASLESIGSDAFRGIGGEQPALPAGVRNPPPVWYSRGEQKDSTGHWSYSMLADGTAMITVFYAENEKITFPESVDGIPVTAVGRDLESDVKANQVRSVAFPDSLKIIGSYAFTGYRLTKVRLPAGLVAVDQEAFSWCAKLNTAALPRGLEYIGRNAFAGTPIRVLRIPESVKYIGEYAFQQTRVIKLEKNSLPSTLKALPRGIFSKCPSLIEAVLPDGLESVEESAFAGCEMLKKVTFGSVAEIGDNAFAGCIRLSRVVLPAKGLKRIGSKAFSYCQSLKAFPFPEGLESIGDKAFEYCEKLKAVELPAGLVSLGHYAFSNCSAVKSVSLPATLREMGVNPFIWCGQLNEILLSPENTDFRTDANVLFTADGKKLICYPAGLRKSTYIIPPGTEEIGDDAFCYALNMNMLTFPDSVTAIGNNAFRYCSDLRKCIVPRGSVPERYCQEHSLSFVYSE